MKYNILIIDNNDSFTYNLVELFRSIANTNIKVINYKNLNHDQLLHINNYDYIVISPGPDVPESYPYLYNLLNMYKDSKYILGVCLGLQTINNYFNGNLRKLNEPNHGKQVKLTICYNDYFINNIADGLIGLYHSWCINKLGSDIKVLATYNDIPMIIKHNKYNIYAVQYHPESFLCDHGKQLIHNWLQNNIKKV